MFRQKATLLALAVLVSAVPLLFAKGGPTSYVNTPVETYLCMTTDCPADDIVGDQSLPYMDGVDGVRSILNGPDLIVNLEYYRSKTRRTAYVSLQDPVVASTGSLGFWSTSSLRIKVSNLDSLLIGENGQKRAASFHVQSADGSRLYRIVFNGNNDTSWVNVSHPSWDEWTIEAPDGSIARVIDETRMSKAFPIGNYRVSMKMTVKIPTR